MVADQESKPNVPMSPEAATQYQAESAESSDKPHVRYVVVKSKYLNDPSKPGQPMDSLIFGPESDEDYWMIHEEGQTK